MPHIQYFGSTKPHSAYIAETLGKSLGEGLGHFYGTYSANRDIDAVLNDPAMQKATTSERMSKLEMALRRNGVHGQKAFANRMMIERQRYLEQEQQREEQEQGVIARALNGEKVSNKELGGISPQNQIKLAQMKYLQEQQKNKLNLDQLTNSSFTKGYNAILSDNNDELKQVVSDPNTPLSVKRQLAELQNRYQVRADTKAGELRRRQSLVQGAYSKAITAERNKIGKIGGIRKEDVTAINSKIAELEKLRQQDMQRILKNPEDYQNLSIWGNNDASRYLSGEEEPEIEQRDEENAEPKQSDMDVRIEFLNKKFPPMQFKGKRKQDKSGRVYQSDGNVWRLIQE